MQHQLQQPGSAGSADSRLPAFSPDWAVFLDIDGTLLELVERPDAVRAALSRTLPQPAVAPAAPCTYSVRVG